MARLDTQNSCAADLLPTGPLTTRARLDFLQSSFAQIPDHDLNRKLCL